MSLTGVSSQGFVIDKVKRYFWISPTLFQVRAHNLRIPPAVLVSPVELEDEITRTMHILTKSYSPWQGIDLKGPLLCKS